MSITLLIIIITVITSLMALNNHQLLDKFKFNAYFIRHSKEWWRFFTSSLVHADFLHLALNMYVLYAFGTPLEYYFGLLYKFPISLIMYLTLYILGSILSSIYSYEKNKNNLFYNAVGASGAVSSIVFATIAINPTMGMGIIFIPGIHIPGFLFGFLYLAYSWYMGRKQRDNIGHDAHFWGSVFGFVFVFATKPALFMNFILQIKNYFGF